MSDPSVQTGFGCVWGIETQNLEVGFGILLPLDEDLMVTRDNEQAYNTVNGEVLAETFYRKQSVIRIRLYPGGSTMGNARSANQWQMEPGGELFLDDPDLAIWGWWVILELGKSRKFDSKAYWDLTLRRHGNNFVGGSNQRLSATVF